MNRFILIVFTVIMAVMFSFGVATSDATVVYLNDADHSYSAITADQRGLRHPDKTPISALLASYDASDITVKTSTSLEAHGDVNRLMNKEGVGGFAICSQPRLYPDNNAETLI